MDADRGETGRIYYEEVPVEKEKAYTMEYTVDTLLDGLTLIDEDGEEVQVTAAISEENLGALSYEVHVEGVGIADSIYNVTPGDYVKLQAFCDANNEFLGWYDKQDNLITKELVYGFSAKEIGEFTAKFTNVFVEADSVSVSEFKVVLEVGEVYFNEATILPENATIIKRPFISYTFP